MHAFVPAVGKPLELAVPELIGFAMTSMNGPSARDSAGKRDSGASDSQPIARTQFLTVAEVAGLMRVSKMTVYRLVHNGELPAVRVGRSFRVHAKAVHDLLETSYFDAG
jgi:excisionase family DNA binding protein